MADLTFKAGMRLRAVSNHGNCYSAGDEFDVFDSGNGTVAIHCNFLQQPHYLQPGEAGTFEVIEGRTPMTDNTELCGGEVEGIRKRHEQMALLIRHNDPLATHQNNALRAHQDRATLLATITSLSEENRRLRAMAVDAWDAITFYMERIRPYRAAALSTRKDQPNGEI